MKKILALVMTFILMFTLVAVSASAAGTYGDYEQKIIALLGNKLDITTGTTTATFAIPADYVNQAKSYFASTQGDLTETQYNEIVAQIEVGKTKISAAVAADPTVVKNGKVEVKNLPADVRTAVLNAGQTAAAVTDLSLTFDGNKVIITDAAGTVKFENTAVIKSTGADVNVALMLVIGAAFMALVTGSVFTAKKAELF